MATNDKDFVQGLFVDKKVFDSGGDITKLSIQVDRFIEYLQKNKNEKGYVNIDVKTSKGGKPYAQLNAFQAKSKEEDSLPF